MNSKDSMRKSMNDCISVLVDCLKESYKTYVLTCTYNHANYIEDCMRGVAMQQTSFPYVHQVLDDASSDGEQDVIRTYMEERCDMENAQYFDNELANIIIVKYKNNPNCTLAVYFLKKNMYKDPHKEVLSSQLRDACEYETLCEGDDFWTDPLKLQMQVDLLDKNPDVGMCYTGCQSLNQMSGKISELPNTMAGIDSFAGFLLDEPVTSLTIMYRTELERRYKNEIKPETRDWLMGDTPRLLWFAVNSKIHNIPQVTSTYRELPESASHTRDIRKKIRYRESTRDIRLFFCRLYPSYGKDLKPKVWEKYYEACINDAFEYQNVYYIIRFLLQSCNTNMTMYRRLMRILKSRIRNYVYK